MTITSKKFDTLIEPPIQLLLNLEDHNVYPCTCSMVVRKSVFKDIGYFEEPFRDALEDMVFHSKLFLKYPVYVSSRCWDRYRIHADSFWRSASLAGKGRETFKNGRLNYLKWLKEYLNEQRINDPTVWKKLNRAFIPFKYPKLFHLLEVFNYLSFFSKISVRKYLKRLGLANL